MMERRSVGGLLGVLLALVVSPVHAQAPVDEPVLIAAEASEVRDAFCSDASNDAVTLQAQGTARVSAVWARVSTSYDAHKAVYLLYWRALLGQCLEKNELVQDDLEAFIKTVGDDPGYSEQVRDAERRLRRFAVVQARESSGGDPRAGIGVGIGVAAGGAALGGLAAWQGRVMRDQNELYHSGNLLTDGLDEARSAGLAARDVSNGLTVVAIATGAAGLTVLAVSAGISSDKAASVVVLPTPDGVVVSFGGRW